MDLGDIGDDDLDLTGSSSSQRRYVQPTRQEFEQFLDELPVEFELNTEVRGAEYVYDSHDAIPEWNSVVLRIYSTIDRRTDKARSKGSDAIRLVIWDRHSNQPAGGRVKTLRIKTWEKNLREKIFSIVNEWEQYIEVCEECGEMMVIRDGQYGEFYGCKGYPDCDNTKNIDSS